MSLEAALPVFDSEGRHVESLVDWSRELDDPAVASELRTALEDAIGALPEEYRAVLVLRDVEGMTTEEAARSLRLTVAAVKSRLHRAPLFVRHAVGRVVAPAG